MANKTIKVATVGPYPLVNADNAVRIDSGGPQETIHTPWIDAQIAAGSLIDLDAQEAEDAAAAGDAKAAAKAKAAEVAAVAKKP